MQCTGLWVTSEAGSPPATGRNLAVENPQIPRCNYTGVLDLELGHVEPADSRIRSQSRALRKELGQRPFRHNHSFGVCVQHLFLVVTYGAYRMERPANLSNLDGAGRDCAVLLNELYHGFAVMFGRGFVGAMAPAFHYPLDGARSWETSRPDDVGTCARIGCNIDFDLLVLDAEYLFLNLFEECNIFAQIFCMPVSRECEPSPVVQCH